MNIPKEMFTREFAEKNKIFEKAERWFNKKSPGGQLEAIYDAYIVHLMREKTMKKELIKAEMALKGNEYDGKHHI